MEADNVFIYIMQDYIIIEVYTRNQIQITQMDLTLSVISIERV